MEIIFILAGIIIGSILGFFVTKSRNSGDKARAVLLEDDNNRLKQEISSKDEQINKLSSDIIAAVSARDVMQEHLKESKLQYDRQLEELKSQQTEQMKLQMALIKEQMNTASEKILKERSEQLTEKNKEALASILNPLKDGISQMKDAVEKSGQQNKETMVRLDATIKQSIEQSREVGERADKLAQALTGENKTQGNFGELRLKQLLEDMGLEEGTQFEEQATMKDSSGRTIYDEQDGHRMIPDIILHFPDERDIIIDSKMSFKAFEDYHNAENDVERQDALTRHIASVRQHVNELSRKNYSAYIKEGRGKLDFVLMYVFSESALQLALMNEPTLWKEAYDKGVIITGSQNLYTMLRVLEMTWRQVRQIENQEQIMKTASMVVDRVQMFYERFLKVDELLDKTKKAFEDVKGVSGPSGQSIETAAKKLIKYGAKTNPKRKYQLKNVEEETLLIKEE
ncbi:MAG: DNA recombination protein RmuC [Prevotella sp.]|nr:DNA recombination protein RmuC [Candidatus Prevotella equi]